MKKTFLIVLLSASIFAVDIIAQTALPTTPTIESILARRSIRKYKSTVVPRNVLDVIAKSAVNAPSAVNRQPWQVRIVTNNAVLKQIGEAYKATNTRIQGQADFIHPFYNAPAVVFIAVEKPEDAGLQFDCGLLTQNIALAAQSLDLGTCIMGAPIPFMNSEAAASARAKLNLPAGYQLIMSVALGYPDEAPEARPRKSENLQIIE